MSLPHKSIATINSPEFINLQPLDINPLMSKCEIKVFYVGENRNGSYIKKEVAMEMAKTLRGAPIVGYYSDEKNDFRDHGDQVILDGDGIHFNCLTKPYGFVAPDAEVWFQKFNDEDDFGNQIEREYLMTTGYLWTEQFPEAKQALETGGRPQSMELDGETLDGHWAVNPENNLEFFIINDAVISKLCILGEDVEPCFEGAAVTKPNFSLDEDFNRTLYSMMKDLEFALKGEHTVNNAENKAVEEIKDETVQEEFTENQKNAEDTSSSSDFAKDDEKKEEPADEADDSEDDADDEEEDEDKKKDFVKVEDDSASVHTEPSKLAKEAGEDTIPETQEEADAVTEAAPAAEGGEESGAEFTAHTEEEYKALEAKYSALQESYNELVAFKNDVEDKEKDALIAQFSMLSDEDKKDVIENKRTYSLEEIEAKLAVICYRKKVNFDLDTKSKNEEEMTDNTVTTFNLNTNDSTPDWIKAVEEVQNRNN
jgi:hypothetical protein